ncbi:ras protein, partial [Ceratobasidium sp. AG-I]
EQWRITMLGDGGVGKTALAVQVSRFQYSLETYDPTIEDAFRHSIVVDDVKSYLEIVDTGGQEEYATLRDQWIHGSGAFILVYSIASRPTFDRIKMFQNSIVRVGGRTRPTIMLVGNKLDKASEREVSQVEAQAFGRQCGCAYMEISAKTASGVERMFNDTIRALRADREASYLRALQGYLAETEEARANGPNVKATSWWISSRRTACLLRH